MSSRSPDLTAPIIGVSRAAQLHDTPAAPDIRISPAQLQQLQQASAPEPAFPYPVFTPDMRRAAIFNGASMQG